MNIEIPVQRGLLKPTLQVTTFTVFSILISFSTQIIVAAKFGATMARDAYFAAVVIPGYITTVLLGALTVTFVPIFIEYETQKNSKEAWKVASIFTNLTFIVLLGIAIIGIVFSRQILRITAPGFKGNELSLTISLLRILLPSIIFTGLTSLLSSIYYAYHRFLLPAAVPVINAIIIIIFVIVFTKYWGIKSLAAGNLAGAVIGFIVLIPIFFNQDRYHFNFDFHNEGVVKIIRVMTPLILAGIFYRAATVIERMIASTLPTGSISYLGYARRIIQILISISSVGISTTVFPEIAKSWSKDDLAKVRAYFARGIRIVLMIVFPIAIGFAALRVPIIQLFLERGLFDHQSTIAVANTLLILLVAFVMMAIGNIVGKPFYVMLKTRLLASLNVIFFAFYIFLAFILAKRLSYKGLAIALSLKTVVTQLTLVVILRKLLKRINGKRILEGSVKILISSFAVFCATEVSYYYLCGLIQNLLLKTCISMFIGIGAYVVMIVYILKLEEFVDFKKRMIGKVYMILKRF